MDNGYRWYSDDYENNMRNKNKNNKGKRVIIYIALVLVSSLTTGMVVGRIMYKKFTRELARIEAVAQSAADKASLASSDVENLIELSKGRTSGSDSLKEEILYTQQNVDTVITDIAEKTGPSIVGIRMTVENPVIGFFGRTTTQSSQAEGSGIIIRGDGYIMTNYHVVEYADLKYKNNVNTVLEVFLPDGRQAKAKYIGGDSSNDLAVIKIDLSGLSVAKLGDSSKLKVGDLAVAIGNPLGLEFAGSVTSGVISALNRKVETDNTVLNLIQTDAAINPGNSGGALVNREGQVIGINTIKISITGVEGLGFAIPINDAKPIIDQLINYGYVKGRPFIGISGQEITETISKWYKVPVGLLIEQVTPGGPAEKAGIKAGDIMISLAGEKVKTMKELDQIKKEYKPEDTVNTVIYRNGRKINLKLIIAEER
jgi:serine protease Do